MGIIAWIVVISVMGWFIWRLPGWLIGDEPRTYCHDSGQWSPRAPYWTTVIAFWLVFMVKFIVLTTIFKCIVFVLTGIWP